jgi:hypothetical protein
MGLSTVKLLFLKVKLSKVLSNMSNEEVDRCSVFNK